MQNRLGLTERVPEEVSQFFGRPFAVITIHGFADALPGRIDRQMLTEAMRHSPMGGIDQISDNTHVLEEPTFRSTFWTLYGERERR